MSKKSKSAYFNGTDSPTVPPVPIQLDREAAAARVAEAKTVPIFSLDGETFAIPAVERAEVGLTYLDLQETKGPEAAAHYLILETLGSKAWKKLQSVKGMTGSEWEGIMARVQSVVMPEARRPKARRA